MFKLRKTPTSRRLRTAVVAPLGAMTIFLAGPAAALIATASPAGATTPTLELIAGSAAVKTSNGVGWSLDVVWDGFVTPTVPALSVGILRTVTTGGTGEEVHSWQFNVKTTSLAFSTKTGVGTLNAGTSASPVATVDLAFKSTKSSKVTCTSGSETIYSGTLKGEVELVTGLTGGGTVGGKTLSFTGSPEIKVDSNCSVPITPCGNETLWASGDNTALTLAGGGNLTGTTSTVSVSREAKLKAPAGAIRYDATGMNSAAPAWNATTKTLSVSTSTGGIITGSATLTGGTDKTVKTTCTLSGKKYTDTTIEDFTANYASPAGKTITGHNKLGGNLVAPATNKGGGLYIIETIKAA
jgi:hypothetical protein